MSAYNVDSGITVSIEYLVGREALSQLRLGTKFQYLQLGTRNPDILPVAASLVLPLIKASS